MCHFLIAVAREQQKRQRTGGHDLRVTPDEDYIGASGVLICQAGGED